MTRKMTRRRSTIAISHDSRFESPAMLSHSPMLYYIVICISLLARTALLLVLPFFIVFVGIDVEFPAHKVVVQP